MTTYVQIIGCVFIFQIFPHWIRTSGDDLCFVSIFLPSFIFSSKAVVLWFLILSLSSLSLVYLPRRSFLFYTFGPSLHPVVFLSFKSHLVGKLYCLTVAVIPFLTQSTLNLATNDLVRTFLMHSWAKSLECLWKCAWNSVVALDGFSSETLFSEWRYKLSQDWSGPTEMGKNMTLKTNE